MIEKESTAMEDLGCVTNIEVINKFFELNGKSLIDAGCGDMTVARMLAENGALVLAIDPDPVQAKRNRESEPIPGIEFVESGAESIPVGDASVDGVFFSYSLHHIPAEIYPEVFQEVRRVIKPGGFLYVIEPTDCPLNQVMILFHDEEQERAAAQTALQELAKPFFETCVEVEYHNIRQYESFEEFACHFASRSFNNLYTEEDVRAPQVQEAFERLGAPDYRFTAPKRVMVLKNFKGNRS